VNGEPVTVYFIQNEAYVTMVGYLPLRQLIDEDLWKHH
jgi:hypothetical protein